MRTADQWISEYGESHQDPLNKKIHYLCVPAILFSIIGLLASIPLGGLTSFFPASIHQEEKRDFLPLFEIFLLIKEIYIFLFLKNIH